MVPRIPAIKHFLLHSLTLSLFPVYKAYEVIERGPRIKTAAAELILWFFPRLNKKVN